MNPPSSERPDVRPISMINYAKLQALTSVKTA